MKDSFGSDFLAGSCAGLASSAVVSPVEHTRIRIQLQSKGTTHIYNGSVDAAVKIFKEYGFVGLQKGWVGTVVRDGPFFGVYYAIYELIMRAMKAGDPNAKTSSIQMIVAGGSTGVLSWALLFPLDTFKSIAQTEDFKNKQFKNYRHLVKDTLRTKGFSGFYNGFAVCLIRGFPVNAITFLFYELSRNMLMKDSK